MEIQKIFSDAYDEERIYSVLMDEEELALFSEVMDEQREFTSKRDAVKFMRNLDRKTNMNELKIGNLGRGLYKGFGKLKTNTNEVAKGLSHRTVNSRTVDIGKSLGLSRKQAKIVAAKNSDQIHSKLDSMFVEAGNRRINGIVKNSGKLPSKGSWLGM